jgi:glycosyltransferase involved in cell wall biosynthesis
VAKKIYLFCPSINDGGLEKTLSIYANFLTKSFTVNLITNTFNNKRLKVFNKKVKIINFRNKFYLKNRIINNLFCVIKTLFKKEKNLIVFSLHDHFFWCLLKFFKFKFKLIIRTSTAIINGKNKSEEKYLKKQFFLRNFTTFFYRYADLVITAATNNRLFLKNKIKAKNVKIIYNYFPRFKVSKKIRKTYNIFFIGRLVPDKDPIFFLKNCINLSKKIDFNIGIIGKGICYKKLKIISEKENVKNVKIYGYIENALKKFNKKIDILCITSKYDGTPNVLGEAASYGIPCLAPKNVGLSNIILLNGKGGYLYKPNSNKDFKKKLSLMISNYNEALKKSQLTYKKLDRFNYKNTLLKLKNNINEIV